MVFAAPEFVFFFLPLVLVLTCTLRVKSQNRVLLLLSLLFYYYGGGWLILLLLASCLANCWCAKQIERTRQKHWLWFGICLNLGNLLYFKYANFLVDQWNHLVGSSMWYIHGWSTVVLPIGISFFTFQGISYLVDVWRREMPAFQKLQDVVLCTILFPHLIAGPIVRFSHLTAQLEKRELTAENFVLGATRFTWGLAKKVLIADVCAQMADAGFGTTVLRLSAAAAWLMLLAYTIQIYFDFSGYSDMAVGLARMLGFDFPENFQHPYSAIGITDFWRRWHLSLSQWFRDYVFIPLGGSREGQWRLYRNLTIVFLITGAWHGAAWTFVLWGGLHGILLMVERVTGLAKLEENRYHLLRRLVFALFIILSWAPFRAADLSQVLNILHALVGVNRHNMLPHHMSLLLDAQMLLALCVGVAAFFMPRQITLGTWLMQSCSNAVKARTLLLLGVLPVCLVQVLNSGYSPFLYFQF